MQSAADIDVQSLQTSIPHKMVQKAAAGPTRPRARKAPHPIPSAIRKETVEFARALQSRHKKLFANDPELKNGVVRLMRVMLPPKPRRRGRPGIDSVTKAISLLAKYKRMYPEETAEQRWQRVYPEAIPKFASMSKHDQKQARDILRDRVRWRRRQQKRMHHRRENSSSKSPSRQPA